MSILFVIVLGIIAGGISVFVALCIMVEIFGKGEIMNKSSENGEKLMMFGRTCFYFRTKVKSSNRSTDDMKHQRIYTMFCFCPEGIHQAIHRWHEWFHKECLALGATKDEFLAADDRLVEKLGKFVCEYHPDLNWRDLPLIIEGELEGLNNDGE